MIEPAKGSSADTKEKDPLLDKDMGKEFFSSWNSMSLTEDDPMDFSFEPSANNQKKTFKFEKLDMGFDLDGDFGKLSSFKVDMPDFDFSSPSKKTAKIKEGSEDKSTGNSKQKKDQFSFSFDFNELDGFDLDSSLQKKGSETSNKSIDCEGAVSKRKGGDIDGFDFDSCLGENAQATSMRNQDIKAVDSDKTENQNSKAFDSGFNADNPRIKQAVPGSMDISELESPHSPWTSNSKLDAICLGPQPLNASTDKTLCPAIEEKDEQSPSTRDTTSSPSHASETAQAAMQGHYANRNDLHGETGSDIHEVCNFGTKDDCLRGPDQNSDGKMISAVEPREERTGPKTSSRLRIAVEDTPNCEQKERVDDTPVEIMDQTRTTRSDPDSANSPTSVSGRRPPDNCANQNLQIQNSDSKLSLALSGRVPKLNSLKTGPIRSRFFKRPDRTESDAIQPCPARLEATREREGLILHPAKGRSAADAYPGGKSGRYTKELHTVSQNDHVNIESAKNIANTSMNRDCLIANAMENGPRLVDSLKLKDKSINNERFILQRSDNGYSSQADASSPTEKMGKVMASGTESSTESKISSLERLKLVKIVPAMPKAKTVRTTGPNKDLSRSDLHEEVSCSINKEQSREVPAKKSSEIHHFFVRNETSLVQPSSLKRKAPGEDPNVGSWPLKPFKRFSMSPSENRNPEESLHRTAEEKFCSRECGKENTTKTLNHDSPNTGSEALQQINLKELEILLVIEKDENVKKAEAYTKELENICNILRKKHEEAKELLVRAVVNNNNLLMLNHPIYEEKIRMVQKFAARLTSKEPPMQSQTIVA